VRELGARDEVPIGGLRSTDREAVLLRGRDFIATYSGGKFWPLAPRFEDVNIHDISHALSMICRFTGHVRQFYSVAQHCWYVSHLVPEQDALAGLLHDAAEAYVCDVSTPVKQSPQFEFYREAEKRIQRAIFKRFGLQPEIPESVHRADRLLVVREARALLTNSAAWAGMPEADIRPLIPREPCFAEQMYLNRFKELTV